MAELSAEATLPTLDATEDIARQVYATADIFYAGGLIEVDLDSGLVSPLGVAGAGAVFVGVCNKTKTTAASSTTKISIDGNGKVLKSIAVTGVTGDADTGKIVYCTTDNITDATLTRASADAIPIGRVYAHISGTSCHVKLFSWEEALEFHLSGAGRETICLGSYPLNAIADGDVATNVYQFNGTGKIVDFYAIVTTPTTDADAAATFNLEINTTNLTGGTITTTDTAGSDDIDVQGGKFSASAITGANVFHDGDTLSIEASSVTDYTDGELAFFIVIERGV